MFSGAHALIKILAPRRLEFGCFSATISAAIASGLIVLGSGSEALVDGAPPAGAGVGLGVELDGSTGSMGVISFATGH